MVVVTDSVTNLFSSSSERDRRFRVDDRPAVRLSQQIMKQRARKNKCSAERSNIMIESKWVSDREKNGNDYIFAGVFDSFSAGDAFTGRVV